jgi:fumarate reductase iron-sulfur subunit
MQIKVCNQSYTIEQKVNNLLSVLIELKTTQNAALAFRSGCKSGICGSCAVVVNGTEQLSCKTLVKDKDIVEPLKNMPIIKDLVVDNSCQSLLLKNANTQLQELNKESIKQQDVQKIDKESNCILCSSCYSSCPVYSVNKDFIGPFTLTRAYRYVEDKQEMNPKAIIDSIQINGVFDCTLCGNCNMVCPSLIDIKSDIMALQNKSVQQGYSNPNLATNSFGFGLEF